MQDRQLGDHSIENHLSAVVLDLKTVTSNHNLHVLVLSLFHMYSSLVPRPSYRLVFDCLQYAKMEGKKAWSFYHMNDFSVYLGRQRRRRSL